MQKYVALLRGINVGGHSKVEMSKLKEALESSGFKNVSTYINSGNAIFETKTSDSDKLAKKIETVLEKTFGFEIKCMVRDSKNILSLCQNTPPEWKNDTKQRTYVIFLSEGYDSKESLKLLSATDGIDSLIYQPGAIIWNLEMKYYSKSGMKKFMGTALYKNTTIRNINTVRKLADLMG